MQNVYYVPLTRPPTDAKKTCAKHLSLSESLLSQVTYYRYFRFFGDGRVAYGLVHESPKEFVRMLQVGSKEAK